MDLSSQDISLHQNYKSSLLFILQFSSISEMTDVSTSVCYCVYKWVASKPQGCCVPPWKISRIKGV